MVRNLDISEENRFKIYTKKQNVLIHFFEVGKFANATVTYEEEMIQLTEEEHATFLFRPHLGKKVSKKKDDWDIKLYLPNTFSYDLSINNEKGKVRIENGSHFSNLEVSSRIIEFINIFAPLNGNIEVRSLMKLSSFTLLELGDVWFKKILRASETSIYLENSSINSLVKRNAGDGEVKIHLNHAEVKNMNIISSAKLILEKDSKIESLKSTNFLRCYAKDSTIDSIECNNYTDFSFENVHVGSIIGKDCVHLILSNCHFMAGKDIILKKGSYADLYFKEEPKYIQRSEKKIYIMDNKKKKMKIKAKSHVAVSKVRIYVPTEEK